MIKDNKLQAGFARVNITPPMGIPIAGYFIDRFADGVLDDLEVNALALKHDNKTVLLMTVDHCGLAKVFIDEFKDAINEKTGVDKDAIYNKVFHTYSEDRLRLMGYCLNKMEIISECNAAIIVLTQEELQKFNYKVGDTEGIVNIPLQIENINKSVLVREDKTQIKLSFRSQGDVAVNTMAEKFGGGGHKNAAGGESTQSMEETLDKLRRV